MADKEDAIAKLTSSQDTTARIKQALPGVILLVFVASILKAVLTPATPTKQLTVVASVASVASATDQNITISGRILQDGDAVGKALVWAVVDYLNGQHTSPTSTQTDERGGFSIGPVPAKMGAGKNEISQATVYARKELPGTWLTSGTTLRGQDTVLAAGESAASQPGEVVGLSPWVLMPLLMAFLISIVLAFWPKQVLATYLVAVFLAIFFSGGTIYFISWCLRYVTTESKSKEIIQLGFASIYRTTYVKEVPPEWAFSFTAPPKPQAPATPSQPSTTTAPPSAPAQPAGQPASPGTTPANGVVQPAAVPAAHTQPETPIDRGFGAPLWVLLVSVVGAAVVTVALTVDEITKMKDITTAAPVDQPDKIRGHLQTLVQHQFFVLFAPLTAIFVYQTLVLASAASSTFAVGVAALGAGPSLSALLTKAGAAATKLFTSDKA